MANAKVIRIVNATDKRLDALITIRPNLWGWPVDVKRNRCDLSGGDGLGKGHFYWHIFASLEAFQEKIVLDIRKVFWMIKKTQIRETSASGQSNLYASSTRFPAVSKVQIVSVNSGKISASGRFKFGFEWFYPYPSSLVHQKGMKLLGVGLSHLVPDAQADPGIYESCPEGEPCRNRYTLLYAIASVFLALTVSFYVFWRLQFRSDDYVLRWVLLLLACFILGTYGTFDFLLWLRDKL